MTPNKQSKSMLSRLMAMENITVVHNPKARTASFDVRHRVLTIPVIGNSMSDELYDMIVAHEVGHALHTPYTEEDEQNLRNNKPLTAALKVSEKYPEVAMGYLNAIEDARIDKLMKEKYSGLRRDYYMGYRELTDLDFFEVNGKDKNALPFIERINLHFKCGTAYTNFVQFNENEMKFVREIDAARTFDEVIDIAKRVFDYAAENEEQPVDGGGTKTEGTGVEGDGDGDAMGKGEGIGGHGGDYSHRGLKPNECMTQRNLDKNLQKQSEDDGTGYVYATVPSIDNSPIVDFKEVASYFDPYVKSSPASFVRGEKDFAEFEAKSKVAVDVMVKQFLMKKAARDSQRSSTSRTGMIDPVRMVNYKFTDDIFLRIKNVKKGKSHGLLFFVDWSGSMAICFGDVLKQTMQMVMFCRRLNIPFEVYGFSSVMYDSTNNTYLSKADAKKNWKNDQSKVIGNAVHFNDFKLLNILSSRMSGNEYRNMMRNLFVQVNSYSGHRYSNNSTPQYSYAVPPQMELGSTPLNECVISAIDIHHSFKASNKLDIVHSVFLTDGESTGYGVSTSSECYRSHIVYKGKTYLNPRNGNGTDCFIEVFKDLTGSRAISFFIDARKTGGMSMGVKGKYFGYDGTPESQKADKMFADEDFAIADKRFHSYDEAFIIRGNVEIDDTDLDDVLSSKKSNTGIKNAFIKAMENRTASRVMLNRFIDLISVE